MTTEDFLSRLRAGLAEDERIARAAADHDTAGTGDGSWFSANANYYGLTLCESESQADLLDYHQTADTEHITRQSPKATLDRVEAIRKGLDLIERRDELFQGKRFHRDAESHYFEQGFDAACGLFIEALAAGYAGGGCEHPDITLEDRSTIGDFEASTYRCTACEDTAIINRVAGDEPTGDEVRRAFYLEPIEEAKPAQDMSAADLHRRFAHPGYEYEITEGPRKAWEYADERPEGEGWERNVDAGRDGWERFDYTEESYWRRPRHRAEPTETGEPT
ncbi:DUF6221 family protein [Nocardia sp. NPDC004260]